MPANFDDDINTPLENLRGLTTGATTFAANVVSLLTAAFGPTNPFGTAATRDAGSAAGNVPILNSDREIDRALLPEADELRAGTVVLARSFEDNRQNSVVPLSLVSTAVAAAATGLDASNFTIQHITNSTSFTPPATGIIMLAAAGGGGHVPPASGDFLTASGAQGTTAADSYLYYGSNISDDNSTSRITVRGGVGGGRSVRTGPDGAGVDFPTGPAEQRPAFVMILREKGAQGGIAGVLQPTQGDAVRGIPGGAGELLLAKVESGRTFRIVNTGGGAGANAPAGSQRGGTGRDGFAIYIQLAAAEASD